eukprot:SAG31_NODE_30386_length_382_cov_0.544170_1_plen_73_part_00
MVPDFYLQLELEKAQRMLLGHLKWRARWKPSELTEDDAPIAMAAGSNRVLGTGGTVNAKSNMTSRDLEKLRV